MRSGRREIAGALAAGLDRYVTTTHIVGGQVVDIDGDRPRVRPCAWPTMSTTAPGPAACSSWPCVMPTRTSRQPGGWGFAERQLRLDWREDGPLEDRP